MNQNFFCKNLEKVKDDDGDDYDDAVIVVPFDGHQVVDVHQAPPLLAYTQNSRGTLLQAHYTQNSTGTQYFSTTLKTPEAHNRHTILKTPEAHYYFFPQLEKSTLRCNRVDGFWCWWQTIRRLVMSPQGPVYLGRDRMMRSVIYKDDAHCLYAKDDIL